jgi:hypothetical protein
MNKYGPPAPLPVVFDGQPVQYVAGHCSASLEHKITATIRHTIWSIAHEGPYWGIQAALYAHFNLLHRQGLG